jgi:hypothetical protein
MKPELLIQPPPVEQPTFPSINVQVSPQSVKLMVTLAAGVHLDFDLNEETMNQLMTLWLQTRKAVAQEMAIIKDIKQSRND